METRDLGENLLQALLLVFSTGRNSHSLPTTMEGGKDSFTVGEVGGNVFNLLLL